MNVVRSIKFACSVLDFQQRSHAGLFMHYLDLYSILLHEDQCLCFLGHWIHRYAFLDFSIVAMSIENRIKSLLCVQLLFAQAISFRQLLIIMSGGWCGVCNCEVRTENHWTSKRHKKALWWAGPRDLSYLSGENKCPCFPAKVEECLDAPPPCAGCGRTFDCDGLCAASWLQSKKP